jgi:hypothetical protein
MGYCDACQSAGSVNKYGFCEICGTEHQSTTRAGSVPVTGDRLEDRGAYDVLTVGLGGSGS